MYLPWRSEFCLVAVLTRPKVAQRVNVPPAKQDMLRPTTLKNHQLVSVRFNAAIEVPTEFSGFYICHVFDKVSRLLNCIINSASRTYTSLHFSRWLKGFFF